MHLSNSHVLVHVSLSILLAPLLVQTVPAQQSPREQLNEYMAGLHKERSSLLGTSFPSTAPESSYLRSDPAYTKKETTTKKGDDKKWCQFRK